MFIELLFGLCLWDVSNRLRQATVFETVSPFQGLPLDCVCSFPRPQSVNNLRLEQPDDGLGKRVVVIVAATDGSIPA